MTDERLPRSPRFLVMFVLPFVMGCGSEFSDKMDKVEVGMTYDGVERILGRPTNISRGTRVLQADTVDFDSSLHATMAKALNLGGNAREKAERILEERGLRIEVVGGLVSVCWEYQAAPSRRDTVSFVHIEAKCDTVLLPVYRYIHTDEQGKRKEIDEASYLGYKQYETLRHYVSAEVISQKSVTKNYRLEKTRIHRVVQSQRVVWFDASSGRVTQTGFQPVDVEVM